MKRNLKEVLTVCGLVIGAVVFLWFVMMNLDRIYEERNTPTVTQDQSIDKGIELNQRYIFIWDKTDNPWKESKHDFYVIPTEVKDGWVRYEYEDRKGFNAAPIDEFHEVFHRVE